MEIKPGDIKPGEELHITLGAEGIVDVNRVMNDRVDSLIAQMVKESCVNKASELNKRLSKKRFIKLLMSKGVPRNKAYDTAFCVWAFRGGYTVLDLKMYGG